MLIGLYRSKQELEHSIGEPLHVQDENLLSTSRATCGILAVRGRDQERGGVPWTAEVTVLDGRIVRVE